jgi:hypothetical protein
MLGVTVVDIDTEEPLPLVTATTNVTSSVHPVTTPQVIETVDDEGDELVPAQATLTVATAEPDLVAPRVS